MTHGKGTETAGRRGPWSILQTGRWHHGILFREVKLFPGRNTVSRWNNDDNKKMPKITFQGHEKSWLSPLLVSVWKKPILLGAPEKELPEFSHPSSLKSFFKVWDFINYNLNLHTSKVSRYYKYSLCLSPKTDPVMSPCKLLFAQIDLDDS